MQAQYQFDELNSSPIQQQQQSVHSMNSKSPYSMFQQSSQTKNIKSQSGIKNANNKIQEQLDVLEVSQSQKIDNEIKKKLNYEKEIDNIKKVMNEIGQSLDQFSPNQPDEQKVNYQANDNSSNKKSQPQFEVNQDENYVKLQNKNLQFIASNSQLQQEQKDQFTKKFSQQNLDNEEKAVYYENDLKPKYPIESRDNPDMQLQKKNVGQLSVTKKHSSKKHLHKQDVKEQNLEDENQEDLYEYLLSNNFRMPLYQQKQLEFEKVHEDMERLAHNKDFVNNKFSSDYLHQNNYKEHQLEQLIRKVKQQTSSYFNQQKNQKENSKLKQFHKNSQLNHCCMPNCKSCQFKKRQFKDDKMQINIFGSRRQCQECAALLNQGLSSQLCQHHGTQQAKKKPQQQLPKRLQPYI